MRKISILTVVLAVTSFLFAKGGVAEKPECGPFEVSVGEGKLEVIDVGGAGLTNGDRRVGRFELLDSGGSVVGYNLFDIAVVGHDEGQYDLIGDAVQVYDNGTIHYKVVTKLPDPTQPKPQVDVPPFQYHVTGGTNAFAGAHGVVRTSLGDDGRRTLALDIACGD